MVDIDLLKNHPETIEKLSSIWHLVLGRIWVPDIAIESVKKRFEQHLNEDVLPITLVAFAEGNPVGMCSLRNNEGIRTDLTPWLGSLVVDPAYQKQGIGRLLIEATKGKARELGFHNLYLFAFDPTIPHYYTFLGWHVIGNDVFRDIPVTVMAIEL